MCPNPVRQSTGLCDVWCRSARPMGSPSVRENYQIIPTALLTLIFPSGNLGIFPKSRNFLEFSLLIWSEYSRSESGIALGYI